jgi:2-polyprenyl-3-methyl-5-hydroxy-6-metoxy-1,4-benzoquinol methylase
MINNKHLTREKLQLFLKNKYVLSKRTRELFRIHIDKCFNCWKIWNNVRWEEAKNKPGLLELKDYLGKKFIDHFDSSWALVEEWNKLNPRSEKDIKNFYKSTENYLYNLIIWNDSGDRYPFEEDLEKVRKLYGVRSVIDFGCGVGNDTLPMLEKGFEVYPIDFNCPSSEFLNWRLKKRSYKLKVIDVEKVDVYPPADMFWAVDVLEHMVNPAEIGDKINKNTKVFAHASNFDVNGGRHPFHISSNIDELEKKLKIKGFKQKEGKFISLWVRK